jgi:hypothetical protein
VAVALVVALSGCMAQQQGGKVKLGGPGPTIVVGGALALGGGALVYAVQSDDENKFNADGLLTGLGVVMIAVGVGAIAYGIYQLSSK